MNMILRRTLGLILALLAAAGLVASLYGLVQVWKLKQPVTDGILKGIELVDSTLKTTQDGLDIVESALTNTATTLASLETATLGMAQSVHDTGMMAGSFVDLFGESLPQTITNTQNSIATAQNSAVVIDNLLGGLSSIPFVSDSLNYSPELPLSAALGQISDSLAPLPASLRGISTDMETTSANLLELETRVAGIITSLAEVRGNLTEAQEVIDEYQADVTDLRDWLEENSQGVPGAVQTIAWVLTILIAALAVPQLGTLVQGLEMLLPPGKPAPPEPGRPSTTEPADSQNP
jgi:hypothetical protein